MLISEPAVHYMTRVLQETDKAMTGDWQRDWVRTSQSDIMFQLMLQHPELMKEGFAVFHSIVGDYRALQIGQFGSDMQGIVKSFLTGTLDKQGALSQFKTMAQGHYTKLFQAGGMALGNDFYKKLGLTKQDAAFLNKFLGREAAFFKNMLNQMEADPFRTAVDAEGNRIRRFGYDKRAAFYGESAKAAFYDGMLAGAGDRIRIKWVLGVPQTSHCDVCPTYSNKIYTYQTLPSTPGAGDTPCLLSKGIGVYTDRGLRRVGIIKVGDLVLTHKGRFRKVNHVWQTPYYKDAIKLILEVGGKYHKLLVTPEHKFMIKNGIWKRTDSLIAGNKLSVISQKCSNCGGIFILENRLRKYCSKKCAIKALGQHHHGNYIYVKNSATIVSICFLKGKRTRYDLEVDEDHSYVTRGGIISKNCLFNCCCHLEITDAARSREQVQMPMLPGMLPTTSLGLTRAGRFSMVYDKYGNMISGDIAAEIERLSMEMNKARQMMHITFGTEKRQWINLRRQSNLEIIGLTQARGYRAVPTVSVSDLLATITDAQKKALAGGESLAVDFGALSVGDEVLFVRGDFSSPGLLYVKGNQLYFKNASDVDIPIAENTDIVFSTRGQASIYSPIIKTEMERARATTDSLGVEMCMSFNAKGEIVIENLGTGNSVRPAQTAEEVEAITGASFHMHTHRSNNAFSPNDIGVAKYYQFKRIAVDTPKYIYEMWPISGKWPSAYTLAEMEIEFESLVLNEITRGRALNLSTHKVWKKLSKKYELEYRRILKSEL